MENKITIGCLGWGSLIWDPRGFPIRRNWFEDGPILPIEFARESSGKRITLVIADTKCIVRSLWAIMPLYDLEAAKRALAERERISNKNIKQSIGYWDNKSGSSHGNCKNQIRIWAENKQIDAVIWTNLKFGFKDSRDTMPEYPQIKNHIEALNHKERKLAEEYIRRAPIQIDTDYRRNIHRDFGWKPLVD